jgi:hypothetical protein
MNYRDFALISQLYTIFDKRFCNTIYVINKADNPSNKKHTSYQTLWSRYEMCFMLKTILHKSNDNQDANVSIVLIDLEEGKIVKEHPFNI